ncbi:hypothetical protein K469DRAFT_94212 [Zopfia rhizophila CBS 207.26]|uniref:Uncharacterized protein n=1 Tax=Zopfia rhizophila CBS 207.26 TaxID=1314779 RepID=A0A6A6EC08_9PEZI|nr:hypothetical protein K469DRAFT_94212 [Zopfia rhizophila CBS 207.26]
MGVATETQPRASNVDRRDVEKRILSNADLSSFVKCWLPGLGIDLAMLYLVFSVSVPQRWKSCDACVCLVCLVIWIPWGFLLSCQMKIVSRLTWGVRLHFIWVLFGPHSTGR